jgi:hypothetical protein
MMIMTIMIMIKMIITMMIIIIIIIISKAKVYFRTHHKGPVVELSVALLLL